MYDPLRIFISSTIRELALERQVISNALIGIHCQPWLFEADAGARPTSPSETYFEAVGHCDVYLGIFWLKYSQAAIAEFRRAQQLNKPCFIYEKRSQITERDPRLRIILDEFCDANKGFAVRRFIDPKCLSSYVPEDIIRWLTSLSRKAESPKIRPFLT